MESFTDRVVRIIQQIPSGKVMTYGQISKLAGSPRGARQVVRILHSLSEKYKLPWHRVINAKGEIGFKNEELFFIQKMSLESEGIKFISDHSINLDIYQYHPRIRDPIMKIIRTTDYELVAKLNKPVHQLHSNLYPKYFKEYNFEAMKETFKSLINNDSFIFLLLEDNDEAIGYAWIEIKEYAESAFKKEYSSVFVHQISIADTQRKKGYGSKLMEEIYQIAKDKEIDLIELDYWFENKEAKDFYRKHGFIKYREFVYKEL